MKKTKLITKHNKARKKVTCGGVGIVGCGILAFIVSLFVPQTYYAESLRTLGLIAFHLGIIIIALGIVFFERIVVRVHGSKHLYEFDDD